MNVMLTPDLRAAPSTAGCVPRPVAIRAKDSDGFGAQTPAGSCLPGTGWICTGLETSYRGSAAGGCNGWHAWSTTDVSPRCEETFTPYDTLANKKAVTV